MSRLECWCVRCSSSPILKHLGHWAAGNLVSCQEWKGLIYKFCGVVNILDIPIFSCVMYHMAPKGETKKHAGHGDPLVPGSALGVSTSWKVTASKSQFLTQPQPQWASPHGWHRAGWRCTCGGGRFAAGLTSQDLVRHPWWSWWWHMFSWCIHSLLSQSDGWLYISPVWWLSPTPLKNHGVRQLGWWHSQLFLESHNPFMFQSPPTSDY